MGLSIIGKTNFRNQNLTFGIKEKDKRQHIYIIGKTGTGKSTLLKNLIIQDIKAGRGVSLIDPHGDLAEEILDYIPRGRIGDTVYFNPADLNYPIGFNPLKKVDSDYTSLVASGVVQAFYNIWSDSWGPRLEQILYNSVVALLEYGDSSLLGLTKMLVDSKFRKKVAKSVKDPVVCFFWKKEFENFTETVKKEAVGPIQNKVGQFLSTPIIRNIVGQTKSSFDLGDILDNKGIFIANLSKGKIGADKANLLGSLLTTQFQLHAFERANIPEGQRVDHSLYIDEFQNFGNNNFDSILSEARKYRLRLVLSHQYIDQLSDSSRSAIFGNIGTMISFRVGASDAEHLAKEFERFSVNDFVNLRKFSIYLKLMIDGVASVPFSAVTLPCPPNRERPGKSDSVIKHSRNQYTARRENIENKIKRFLKSKMN